MRRRKSQITNPRKTRIETRKTRIEAFYKPRGVVTTRRDEKGRPTVFSLLPSNFACLHTVGRLDMASCGLLLLTNNTRLSSWLTDPVNKIPRVYIVTVRGRVTECTIEKMLRGVIESGELLQLHEVVLNKVSGRESHMRVTLTEGKNREIRRLFKMFGHEVTRLKRIAFGGLKLGDLQPGQYREVDMTEIAHLFPGFYTGINTSF